MKKLFLSFSLLAVFLLAGFLACATTQEAPPAMRPMRAAIQGPLEIPEGWDTGTPARGFTRINSAVVFPIARPAAGNFPNALFEYPFRIDHDAWLQHWVFRQTIEWYPDVTKVFETNTSYTAILILDPVDGHIRGSGIPDINTESTRRSLRGITQDRVTGLPTDGVQRISARNDGESIRIYITFEPTGSENVPAIALFEDNFTGAELDLSRWSHAPEAWLRQGRSHWRNDMVSIVPSPEGRGGNALRLGFRRDPELGEQLAPAAQPCPLCADNPVCTATPRCPYRRDRNVANWLRASAVQTQRVGSGRIFSNTFGYWEARIRFPAYQGMWGAFWLMSNTIGNRYSSGVHGTEIDIIESIGSAAGQYMFALHWNYHGPNAAPSAERSMPHGFTIGVDDVPNIYDGQFHVFSLCWSPSYYIFYVNGIELWRVSNDGEGLPRAANRFGIMRNPSYMIISVEAGDWGPVAGVLPEGFTESAVYVDWVRVWNQPRR